MKKIIYTIGHSNRPISEFLKILKAFGISAIADVRSIPASRHNPQFGENKLKKALHKAGINYYLIKKLGGLRHTTKSSVNLGWRNASFRGYADYMQTPEFKRGIAVLEKIAKKKITALMCAESLPWRCHRSLIADALTLRKWKVEHIFSKSSARPHIVTPFLKFKRGVITYPKTI